MLLCVMVYVYIERDNSVSSNPGGISRRQLMRAGVAVPAAAWVAPVVTSLRPAAAIPGSPMPEPPENPPLNPTDAPTTRPTDAPTTQPTDAPTTQPTEVPTGRGNPGPGSAGPSGGRGTGRGSVPSLPATGLNAGSLAALGSASAITGAAILAQAKKYSDESADD